MRDRNVVRAMTLRERGARGVTLVEYALLAGLLAVGVTASVVSVRNDAEGTFGQTGTAMSEGVEHGTGEAPATPGTPTTPTTPTTPGGTTSRPGGTTTTPGGTTGGTTGGATTPTTPGGSVVEPLVATGAITDTRTSAYVGVGRDARFNVDFRRRSAKDWAEGRAMDRHHYSGGSRMDKKIRQPVAMMDGKGGLSYDSHGLYTFMAANGFAATINFRTPNVSGTSTPDTFTGTKTYRDNVLLSTMASKGSVGFELVQEGDTLVANYVSAPGARPVRLVATGLAASRWTGATLVQGSGVLTLYVNGQAVVSAPAAGLTGTPADVKIGFRTTDSGGTPQSVVEGRAIHNTAVSNATITDHALTADEVASHTLFMD